MILCEMWVKQSRKLRQRYEGEDERCSRRTVTRTKKREKMRCDSETRETGGSKEVRKEGRKEEGREKKRKKGKEGGRRGRRVKGKW